MGVVSQREQETNDEMKDPATTLSRIPYFYLDLHTVLVNLSVAKKGLRFFTDFANKNQTAYCAATAHNERTWRDTTHVRYFLLLMRLVHVMVPASRRSQVMTKQPYSW